MRIVNNSWKVCDQVYLSEPKLKSSRARKESSKFERGWLGCSFLAPVSVHTTHEDINETQNDHLTGLQSVSPLFQTMKADFEAAGGRAAN